MENKTESVSRSLCVALPSSLISQVITYEQKTILVGQIARGLAVFGIAEVVIYDDSEKNSPDAPHSTDLEFFCRNLEYLETPPYLKKLLFPMHPHLKFAGLAPPLDCMHHLRREEWSRFREGVVLEDGVSVEVGLRRPATLSTSLEPLTRITFEFDKDITFDSPTLSGKAVSPLKPIKETRKFLSWGFAVRAASSLEEALKGQEGYPYDLRIGVKDRDALALRKVVSKLQGESLVGKANVLLVFYGQLVDQQTDWKEVKPAEPAKKKIPKSNPPPHPLIDMEINFAEWSQSRHLRTEEMVWMALTGLRGVILNWIRRD